MTGDHDTELDYVGINMNHPRLTCFTCKVTLVHQPYMSHERWLKEVISFSAKHPSTAVSTYLDKLLKEA